MELTTPIDLNISRALWKKSFFHKFFVSRAKDEIASKDSRVERKTRAYSKTIRRKNRNETISGLSD